MASDVNGEEDSIKFTECGFCGVSRCGDGLTGEMVTLRTCNRCKSVAYCSRDCQRSDYRKHKGVCRKIGIERDAMEQDTTTLKAKVEKEAKADEAGAMRESPPITRGIPAPLSHPRTSIRDPVEPALMNKHVVLHSRSATSHVGNYLGVYSPLQSGPFSIFYVYDRAMTFKFCTGNNNRLNALQERGFHFDFVPTQEEPRLIQAPNRTWSLLIGSGERFNEIEIPRSRGQLFWEDPNSLLYMNPSDIYSTWVEDTQGPSRQSRSAQIAITPLETLIRAAGTKSSTSIPVKYRKSTDFSVWNRSFVLHVDPRTCQVPLPWIDTLMGVYTPLNGKLSNGYPLWERECSLTTKLIDAISDPVKKCLENQGIRVGYPGNERRLLCVSKYGAGPSLLSVTKTAHMSSINRRNEQILEASHVPSCVAELLVEPALLFTSPDKAFSTWKVHYDCQWLEIHVAFTPKEFFEQAINLASLDSKLVEEKEENVVNTSSSKKKNKKKKRKKGKSSMKALLLPSPTPGPPITQSEGNSIEPKGAGPNEAANKSSTSNVLLENDHPKPSAKKKKKSRGPSKSVKTEDKQDFSDEGKANTANDDSQAQLAFERIKNIIDRVDDTEQATIVNSLFNLERQIKAKEEASPCLLWHLASLLKVDPTSILPSPPEADDLRGLEAWSIDKTFQALLEEQNNPPLTVEPFWLMFDDTVTSPILKAAASTDPCEWIAANASQLVILFSKRGRRNDLTALLEGGVSISTKALTSLLSSLPRGRGDSFNNKIVRLFCASCKTTMDSEDDFGEAMHAASHVIGKGTKAELVRVLKAAQMELQKCKRQNTREKKAEALTIPTPKIADEVKDFKVSVVGMEEKKSIQVDEIKKAREKIHSSLSWYNNLLEELMAKTVTIDDSVISGEDNNSELSFVAGPSKVSTSTSIIGTPKATLSSEEVVAALSSCDTEDALSNVETSIDLFQWDSHSAWTIDITEQAHKWFRRHIKKDKALCVRIIRRLTLLSTGRWPYVLCKPLRSKQMGSNGKKINLYETKIDSASRIIWEVAIAFSPRRSSLDKNYCEQVIRVWDIVLDHDNLSRAISQTIERIEKSHIRGQECAIFAELDKSHIEGSRQSKDDIGISKIPRVFPMTCVGASARIQTTEKKSRHFHPASDDPRQFTLLKFYELNAGAIKILLDGKDESVDLPFTPGPKEHAIIHHKSEPQRSILLMGRSGTGKTTCLVFRMWAQCASNTGEDAAPLRQLFLTKNDVLCREVERSFNNMGLAWIKRQGPDSRKVDVDGGTSLNNDTDQSKSTTFMTSNEWLEALDVLLPGQPFFTPQELEQRNDDRRQKDTVTKGVEALLSGETNIEKVNTALREELSFPTFRKLWRKIRSGSGSQMDCTIVWREIKSFIKGSVSALHIGEGERSRFLSREEYLALPRKQSRMDQTQRQEVYDLYLRYEKLKKEGFWYDEGDVVYNIAGRISLLNEECFNRMGPGSVLPIDSLYVDEVQDWTQAELYILAKLCRNPNGLFLAGDTAQSIAVGVDFRFADLRQIFYNNFGGIEPELLQLSHNYRSHSGVLRLAACVVELLYFFFSNSLDKLPPDLGLFSGPRPVIMEVTSTADLILMLDGAKRETSRIEFGAHQVVIVRSEKSLPEEFGVDSDWVMTVQQSKGLEFDDVLLYNFFTDSPAGDLWRVVSNYTKDDIDNYYSDISVASSGVQKYDWDDSFLSETRHLNFSQDQHKILETELKMLYTAITRARVNVFIAETDVSVCKPMFNYFQRRSVVDVVSKESKGEGLSGVRVFGAMNTVQDWKSRGEYYLRMAEGERQKGCLRLAAKCFDKSGEVKRRDFALAFLAFTEIEEEDGMKKRGRQAIEMREKLYSITGQLLDARDVGFLNKAALCLLRTGEHDVDAARMFELYGRISYAKRIYNNKTASPPSMHEKKYFTYAGKIFAKCIQQSQKRDLAIDCFRCYLCAGNYEDATHLLSSSALRVQDRSTFEQLSQLCLGSHNSERDPITFFQKEYTASKECTVLLREAINKVAKVGCRLLCKDGNSGFLAALRLLALRSDRIELLISIDTSVNLVLSKKPWSSHSIFSQDSKGRDSHKTDFTDMLVAELELEESHEAIARILEDRGLLLEAAQQIDQLLSNGKDISGSLAVRSAALKTKFVELMLLSPDIDENRELLVSILEQSNNMVMDVDTRCSSLLSSALLDDSSELMGIFSRCNDSIMWQNRILQLAFEKNSNECLLAALTGSTVSKRLLAVYELAKKMISLASALRRPNGRSPDDQFLVSHAERFFELSPKQMDHSLLETKPVINSRLREVLFSEQCDLSNASSLGFTQSIDREKVHIMLANFITGQAALLMMKLSELAGLYDKNQKSRPARSVSIADLRERVQCLQLNLLCKKDTTDLVKSKSKRETSREPWKQISKTKTGPVVSELLDLFFHEKCVSFEIKDNHLLWTDAKTDTIVIQKSAIDAMLSSEIFSTQPMKIKKCDIKHTVVLWRLRSLYKDSDFANKELLNDVVQLEKHASTKSDVKGKRRHYFINKKNQIFPRLWLWAVESLNVMNSISVVERIIDTSLKDGLTSLSKLDQISLLEVNVVALFGSLSLRYSEAEAPPILIPKYSYLQGLLTGETGIPQFQGFGAPLKDVLLNYCHRYFDRVFPDVVKHLEKSVAIILDDNLLSPDGNNENGTFSRAFFLGVFLCCNAVIFSAAGNDMDLQGYRSDLTALPSLPLQGNVKRLVAKLLHVNESISTNLPSTLLDLATFADTLQNPSGQDHLVLCHLKQQTEELINVEIVDNISSIQPVLRSIPFHPSSHVFNVSSNNITFLDDVDPGHDEVDHGKKSEELNAVRLMARLAKSKAIAKANADAAMMYFKRWKVTMRIVIRLLKNKIAKKAFKASNAVDSGRHVIHKFALTDILNPFADNKYFHRQREMLRARFNNAIVDGIECTYCCTVFDPIVRDGRSLQWDTVDGRRSPFPVFAQYYNRLQFGHENVVCPGLASHAQGVPHQDNVVAYMRTLDELVTLSARFSMGLELLFRIVRSCDQMGELGGVGSVWYLTTGEESRALIVQLQRAYGELANAGMNWSRQPSLDLRTFFYHSSGLPQHVESFFMKKREEEVKMNALDDDSTFIHGDATFDNPIEELIRGPYLNPEAQDFIPKFGK